MRLSTLLNGLGFLAVAVNKATAQNNWMNPITICNNFPENSGVNVTFSPNPMKGQPLIESARCMNVSAGDFSLFQNENNGNSVLGLNMEPQTPNAVAYIEASNYGDMIMENANGGSYACVYRTSKNEIEVTPMVDYVCPESAPSLRR